MKLKERKMIYASGTKDERGTVRLTTLSKYHNLIPNYFSIEIDINSIRKREKGAKQ